MRTETKLNIAVAAAVVLLAAAFKLSAAPTANEDYVDAQDAQTYTNALRDANAYTDAATGAVRRVDGEARVLPRYLHTLKFYDSYPDVADWYYSRYGRAGGACSSVRDGNTLARNYDWDFDAAPSFVIGMDAGPCRFASVGVASVGTNLTEDAVTRGRPSKFYKALPGMTLDGVNENGVAANVNVVSSFGHTNGWHGSALHCLGAVRWVLDHATNAQHGAEFLAANVYVPQSMLDAGYSYHYMIADAAETWIAEDGQARMVGTVANRSVMTNFRNFDPLADPYGTGRERYTLLENGGSITSAWFTLAYVSPGRESEFLAPGVDSTNACARAVASWATKPKEQHRGETFEGGAHWWQSVHTSVYDLTNRVLRVAVQEVNDWYTFQVPNVGGVKAESDPTVPDWAKQQTPPEPGNYQAVSNRAMSAVQVESDPTVPAWAKSPTSPAPGNYAAVSNKAMSAIQVETDPTVPAWAKVANPPAPGNYNTVSNRAMSAVQQGTLATVATSGSYNDLLNKPTIPEAVTDQHIKEVAEENRTDHPYLEVRDGGIYVVIPE